MIYKLRPSIAVVDLMNRIEFFLTNIRKSISLEIDYKNFKDFIFEFDGKTKLEDIIIKNKIIKESNTYTELLNLINYLNQQNILLKIDETYIKDYYNFPRIFSLLEDFSLSISEINEKFINIKNSKVMIIGLGSVGTWVANSLVMSGVENLILIDGDKVEITNLHRQLGYFEENLNKYKVDVAKENLYCKNKNINIDTINNYIDSNFFEKYIFENISLIINCADYPSVDTTSNIIGEYALKNNIPHIIGGGYNLHLTLIGQVIIPHETACVNCFRKNLEEINKIDDKNIKKLNMPNRKIGSFPPLSALSASITSNEAFKILAKINSLNMINKRTEFLLENMNFKNLDMTKREDCEWCGKKGKYTKL